MEQIHFSSRLIKKAAAAAVSIVMIMCMASPALESTGLFSGTLKAYAYDDDINIVNVSVKTDSYSPYKKHTVEINGCTYGIDLHENDGSPYVEMMWVGNDGKDIILPDSLTIDDVTADVEVLHSNFGKNVTCKEIRLPSRLRRIKSCCFMGAKAEKLTLRSEDLVFMDGYFYKGGSLKEANIYMPNLNVTGTGLFDDTDYMEDQLSKNSYALAGSLLLKYKGDAENLKIADLGPNITMIGPNAFIASTVKTLDITGVKNIGVAGLYGAWNLEEITGTESLEHINYMGLAESKWEKIHADDDVAYIGKVLAHYKVKDNTADLTGLSSDDMTYIYPEAFKGDELHTLKLRSDLDIPWNDILKHSKFTELDTVILDGKTLTYSEEEPYLPDYIADNYEIVKDSQFELDFAAEKTKSLFKKLSIDYYGPTNEVKGTLSAEDEFNIMLKIHDYIVTNYKYHDEVLNYLQVLTCDRSPVCQQYAQLTTYLLESAGVEAETVVALGKDENGNVIYNGDHAWALVKIGDEWFHVDTTWDSNIYEQGKTSTNTWFMLSDTSIKNKDFFQGCHDMWSFDDINDTNDPRLPIFHNAEEMPTCDKLLGDANNDGIRNEKDVETLSQYLMKNRHAEEGQEINVGDDGNPLIYKENCDMDFNGEIDICDVSLLQRLALGKTHDPLEYLHPSDDEEDEELPETPDTLDIETLKSIKHLANDYVRTADDFDFIEIPELPEKPEQQETAVETPEKTVQKGDINGDSKTDVSDISLIAAHVKGIKQLEDTDAADLDGNGMITVSDISKIAAHVKGIKALG